MTAGSQGRLSSEWERDQNETEFTELLRALRRAVPAIDVAVFVDEEGECIDYVSTLEPFEAKVMGAQMHDVQKQIELAGRGKVDVGFHYGLEIACEAHEVWTRRISSDYVLVVRVTGSFEPADLRASVARACFAFRATVGIETPGWEPPVLSDDVQIREAVGWDYAPTSFREHGEHVAVADVLGRWVEEAGGSDRVCFRVRTDEGRELTLVHDHGADAWRIRT